MNPHPLTPSPTRTHTRPGEGESDASFPARVCLVFPHVLLGGGEAAMLAVAEGLRAAVDLHVCALDNTPVTVETTLREELVERFGAVSFIRRRWELRPCFRKADVVLWYGVVNAVPDVLASLDRRPASVRVIHTDRAEDGPGFHRRWRRVIDRTICVSPAVARRIPGAAFIPNTCSPDRLLGPRHELFPPGRKTLGFLGRLVPQKNAAWLVENAAVLDCNLLVQALDTQLQTTADLRRLAERQGIADRVCFLPPERDVGTLLRSVDAVVIASQHEGFPMVAVEAGLLGTPVIATRVGALPEVFPDQILFVDGGVDGPPELSSMRNAVAAANPDWGSRLRERVEELCARETVVARYLEVLRAGLQSQPFDVHPPGSAGVPPAFKKIGPQARPHREGTKVAGVPPAAQSIGSRDAGVPRGAQEPARED